MLSRGRAGSCPRTYRCVPYWVLSVLGKYVGQLFGFGSVIRRCNAGRGAPEPGARHLCFRGLEDFDRDAGALERLADDGHTPELVQHVAVQRAMLELRKRRIEEVVDFTQVCIA